ncbi:fibrinogen- and Ig-binding protein [Neodiprion pinetum]|uniref:fibrinogen- and Ig-binding protein n=1 Tax=Neodiprion pinetum TaxID=441929 RepID=UPI0037186004
MSRYHVIDKPEGKGYVDVQHHASSYSSSSPSPAGSPRVEHFSTGRGDPLFPDIDMQLGMILGMNSGNGGKVNLENGQQPDERLMMRLKFLEDSNTVMQTRNQNLITENNALHSQLEKVSKDADELRSQMQKTLEELKKERCKIKESQSRQTETMDENTSTGGLISTIERSVQCWAVCLACQRKLEGLETMEPTVTITKTELESLESDMQALRDAVVAREEAWDRAMEREQNYRQQLARLSAETVTARHLSDTRHSELEAVNVAFAEKEAELKATQKDLLSLQKIVVKFERRQRDLEDNFDLGNAEANANPMSEKEVKTIEEILRRQASVKPKFRSRTRGTSSMPQSLQASPRSARTRDSANGAESGLKH